MKNYYCLVAGMPDVALDDSKLPFHVSDFKDEYLPQLAPEDRKLVELFYLQYDNQNLLNVLEQKEDSEPLPGLFTREELEEEVRAAQRDEACTLLPEYMYRFIREYSLLKEESNGSLPEDILTGYYYDEACKVKNTFVKEWFTFNQNVNNILIAFTARRFGFPPASFLVGQGDLVHLLATSAARDFGIGSDFEYIHELMSISELSDPVEKERKIDLLKWNWLEEHTFFHYFSIEKIFAFLQKLNIIERWTIVDKERGGQVFRNMIQQLKDEVEVPSEFRTK